MEIEAWLSRAEEIGCHDGHENTKAVSASGQD